MNQESQPLNKDIIQDFFENFDFKFLIYVAKKSLIFTFIILFLCIIIPFIYLRYTTPVFETSATLIKKKENTNSLLDGKGTDLLTSNEVDKINRDILVIKSDLLVNRLMDSLNMRVQYYKKGRMFYKRFELYPGSIFKVDDNYQIKNKSLLNKEINIVFNGDMTYDLSYVLGGKTIKIENLKLNKLYLNEDLQLKIIEKEANVEGSYIVVFNSDQKIRDYILSQIQVTNSNPNILFSIKNTSPSKSENLLSTLINGFLNYDQIENAERLENSILYIKNYLDTINNQVKI